MADLNQQREVPTFYEREEAVRDDKSSRIGSRWHRRLTSLRCVQVLMPQKEAKPSKNGVKDPRTWSYCGNIGRMVQKTHHKLPHTVR